MLKSFFENIKKFKSYILFQTRAEIKSDITGSYLGLAWVVLEPLAFMLIYTFIGEMVFDNSLQYFPIFIFSGLMFWEFFSNVLKKSTKLIQSYKEIVSKVYVPKYIFIIITIMVHLFKLAITFGLLLLFMIVYQVPVSLNILWLIPLIINLIVITFGISTFFVHYGVIITDLVSLTNILLKFLFYFAGIFYSITDTLSKPLSTILYLGNPIAFLITEFRNSFIYCTGVNLLPFVVWFLIGLVLSYFGLKLINKYENTYVKVMR